jgi:hypothetical protein
MKPTSSYTKEGLKICSNCKIAKSKEFYHSNSAKWDKISNTCKECNKKAFKLRDKEKERIRRRVKYLKYKKKEIARDAVYKQNRYKTDPSFKMIRTLRVRHYQAVKAASANKNFKTVQILGCTGEELKQHIENQFTAEMNWDNHGSFWHIDHIYPLALVDWNNKEQVEKVCNYKNLQPLTVLENIRKGKTVSQK